MKKNLIPKIVQSISFASAVITIVSTVGLKLNDKNKVNLEEEIKTAVENLLSSVNSSNHESIERLKNLEAKFAALTESTKLSEDLEKAISKSDSGNTELESVRVSLELVKDLIEKEGSKSKILEELSKCEASNGKAKNIYEEMCNVFSSASGSKANFISDYFKDYQEFLLNLNTNELAALSHI